MARPTASSLNYAKGWTGANSVTVKVGANGKVDLYNAGGPAHLIADVFGYYTQGHECCSGYMGGQYHPLAQPVRLTDTRDWGSAGSRPATTSTPSLPGTTASHCMSCLRGQRHGHRADRER